MSLSRWWRERKMKRAGMVREVQRFKYHEAGQCLIDGWTLAIPEEDVNRELGIVLLERWVPVQLSNAEDAP